MNIKPHLVYKTFYRCEACERLFAHTNRTKPTANFTKCPYCEATAWKGRQLEGFLDKKTNKIRLFEQKLLLKWLE